MISDSPHVCAHETAKLAQSIRFEGSGTVIVGEYATIEDNVLLSLGFGLASRIEIGARSKIKYGAVLRCYDGWIRIGKRSSIGEYCILTGHGGLNIGDAVIVAGHSYLTAADHIFSGNAPIRFQGETAKGIIIEDGAWLGARSVVLDGVRVGSGCVVGAGSVVTRSLSPSTVCVGAPCREVRSR